MVDILSINTKIKDNLMKNIKELPRLKENLFNIEKTLQKENMKDRVKTQLIKSKESILKKIDDLECKKELNFYILKSLPLIEKYKKILNTPVKLNFMGKKTKNSKEKNKLIQEFLKIASSYIRIEKCKKQKKLKIKCHNCSNTKNFDIIDNSIYICTECYTQQNVLKYNSSYNDIDRVNISTKYMYDRKIHFRDCIKQYQGKQNSTIPDKIYNELEKQFELHHILIGDKNTPKKIRFKKVTKNHILMFLKDLGYSNHYENVHLMHYNFTGIKPDDISYLEDKLLNDFDSLTELYDKKFKHIKRKNFINTQYVLYQLLQRHKHACKKEEFIILKTIDRKFFHDEVCKELFESLGWNHTPFY